MPRKIRTLLFSTLYPSSARPNDGPLLGAVSRRHVDAKRRWKASAVRDRQPMAVLEVRAEFA